MDNRWDVKVVCEFIRQNKSNLTEYYTTTTTIHTHTLTYTQVLQQEEEVEQIHNHL